MATGKSFLTKGKKVSKKKTTGGIACPKCGARTVIMVDPVDPKVRWRKCSLDCGWPGKKIEE